mgnify:CR=1 FL=1
MLQDKQKIIKECKDLQKQCSRMLIKCMELRDSEPNIALCPEWEDVKDFEQGSREKNIYQINGYLENLVDDFIRLDECLDRIIVDRY